MESQNTLATVIGVLTEEQVTAQLPFETPGIAALLTSRLIARRSLKSVPLGNSRRILAADLTAFIMDAAQNSAVRKALNLPMETLSPIFPLGSTGERNWYLGGPAEFEWSMWRQEIASTLKEQFPTRILLAQRGLASTDPDVLMVESAKEQITIQARAAEALVALIRRPAPAGLPFLNLGEYHLCKRLHELVWFECGKRFLANGVGPVESAAVSIGEAANPALTGDGNQIQPQSGRSPIAPTTETSPAFFYRSPETYAAIAGAAAADLAGTASFQLSRKYPQTSPDSRGQGWPKFEQPEGDPDIAYPVLLQINDAALLVMAGTSAARLICLAF